MLSHLLRRIPSRLNSISKLRFFSSADDTLCPKSETGLILGIYSMNDGRHETSKYTLTGQKFNKKSCFLMESLIRKAGPCPKLGEYRILYDIDPVFPIVCVVGLGLECAGYDEDEQLDKGKENIRVAAGVAAKVMVQFELSKIYIEGLGHPESTAEGAALAIWVYQDFKNPKYKRLPLAIELFDDNDWTGWQIGMQKAAAQNLARSLMEAPANKMTPIVFAQNSVEVLCKAGINVEVKVQNWCECLGMGAFLAVGKGSCESPLFMEISYYGAGNFKERPVVLIGKGVTYDSGGLMLNKMEDLINAKGDMSGAACVVAACRAVAALQLPINIRGLIPLCENMPGCNAMKPGDIVQAMNGRSIYIQDTRCEGRLILADALCYAQSFCPRFIVDIGSMTKGIREGFSTAAVGVFTNSTRLWKQIRISGIHTGDRVWRMPLFSHYASKIKKSSSVDFKNYGRMPRSADPCRAAAFLHEFVPCGEWLHIDNFGVSVSDGITDPPYLSRGMTGRPTRTLVEFLSQLCCRQDEGSD
ncbi:Cytosol aminopeptidase, putative [Pediculus humanus corporis]|uniref:Cytosol aminopeptidase n=1 Tax=Pediculus humanus subsp. corporis TaxID=121224 RepID=E0VLX3_PEDHC|nr:Cytosol aminopeptidase, putative [Pediculus humanus corporis]EEB14379.1 Cytosol aminopeptidase, putative [Pediculus humanus corporis]